MATDLASFHKRAVEEVKCLWHSYIINQMPGELEQALEALPDDLLMIGTGRHEFYKSLKEFLTGMTGDQLEARDIQFELQDEWYDVRSVTDDVCVVFGSIWAREKAVPGKAVLVDMEGSRFTVVCRDTPDGIEVCSIHHSMPYLDQGEDEYYPKTLASLANEAVKKSKALERRVELDHMTELYNRTYLEWHVSHAIRQQMGVFYIFDLDDFKSVNDSMGHPAGDRVIQAFAKLLKSVFAPSAILGRMGGDEFAVWDVFTGEQQAEERLGALADGCRRLSCSLGVLVSSSAGLAVSARTGEEFAALYQRADRALYRAKRKGKGCHCWAEKEF